MRRDEEFRAFVERRRGGLVRAGILLTSGDAHLAEDLVQATLTKLYLAWPRVRAASGPDAYANRILVNTFLDDRRRPARRREQVTAELPEPRPVDAISLEERDAVRSALGALPPRMRAAVVLRHWMQLDVAAAASVLACSEGTVKSQTARALDRMRALLTPADTDPIPDDLTGTDSIDRSNPIPPRSLR